MISIKLLDCTLRDGGYINDWNFGEKAIKDITYKLSLANLDVIEVGFLKGSVFNKDKSVYPNTNSMKDYINPKAKKTLYAGMIDMSNPISLESISPYSDDSIDIIRVIFKKDKIDDAFYYCEKIQELGYQIYVQPVGIDNYDDGELVELINKFNVLNPDAFYIVDSFGLVSKQDFIRLVLIANHNMKKDITLGYHSHNNMQQAFANAQAMVELGINRNMVIDVSIYGMGRGAGNLNSEIFATFLNNNYNKNYKIDPLLELIDEYIAKIFSKNYWGYSLPLYLSALYNCHPNYAIYYSEKNTLSIKSMNEILKSIDKESKKNFSKEYAEEIYCRYQENFIDDSMSLESLKKSFKNKNILVIASGSSIVRDKELIDDFIIKNDPIVISMNFIPKLYDVDFIFCSNEKRLKGIDKKLDKNLITTSNVKTKRNSKYRINYQSLLNADYNIAHNSTLLFINLLVKMGINNLYIAGFDGYTLNFDSDYFDENMDIVEKIETRLQRNSSIRNYLKTLESSIKIQFITDSIYLEGEK